jgi:hypothetical protein
MLPSRLRADPGGTQETLMNEKTQIMAALRAEYERWDEILSGMSDTEAAVQVEPSDWSARDIVVHLWAWQQRSIARMEAALHDHEPEFPDWPTEFDPEAPGQPHDLNAWLYAQNRDKSWSQVYDDWQAGFQRFIKLGESIPEDDLFAVGRYSMLESYPLAAVLDASRKHHEEHRKWLTEWLDDG